jgi:CheY-like chemotaxis protein
MVDLNKVIVDMEKMLHRLIGEDIELVALPDPDLRMVKVDPGQMDQLLINLGVNARDAMPSGGKLTVETSNFYLDENYALAHPEVSPGSYVMLAVSDSGTGMTEDVKARIFEPFFTTKGPGKGTGLGLSTCYGIVKQNGGNISVYSEPGSGTTFKVYLPVLEDEIYPETESAVAGSLPGGTETIFLVEDERAVQEIASIILREQGYKVMEASNGIEALEMVKSGIVGKIDLLLADVVMPVMGGKELANQLTSMHPEIKVLFTSGYTDDAIVRQGVLEPGTNFIQKPLTRKTLTTRVREVLDSRKMPV